jgi:hypothetical protein
VWFWAVMARLEAAPADVTLNVACVVLSPQFTSTAHGLSYPGSLKVPSVKLLLVPSSAAWLTGAVTVGGTLFTWTDVVYLVEAPSLSKIHAATVLSAGPSL